MNTDSAIRRRRLTHPESNPDLDRFRGLLLQKQEELRQSLGTVSQGDAVNADDLRISDDTADRASHLSEQEVTLLMLERVKAALEEIALSLERIDEGFYGRCLDCGEPIQAARLEALPSATQCIGCKTRLENS